MTNDLNTHKGEQHMANYAKLSVEETDNGWIVETGYFCHGNSQRKVFLKFGDVIKFIEQSMRQEP